MSDEHKKQNVNIYADDGTVRRGSLITMEEASDDLNQEAKK